MKRIMFYLIIAGLVWWSSALVRRYLKVRVPEVLNDEIEWGTPLEDI